MRWLDAFQQSLRREVQKTLSHPWEIFIFYLMPFVWLLILWGLLGKGMIQDLPVALIDNDNTSLSRTVSREINATRSIDLVSYLNQQDALDDLKSGKVYGVILIPRHYEKDLKSGAGSPVVAFLGENRYAAVSYIEQDLRSAVSAFSQQRSIDSAAAAGGGFTAAKIRVQILQPDFYPLANPASNFNAYLGSSLLPGVLQLAAIFAFATVLLREETEHTIQEWLSNAGHRFSAALAGKILPVLSFYFLIGAWYVALIAGAGAWSPAGSLGLWLLAIWLLLLTMAGFALLFTAITPNGRLALVVCSGFVAPALPFSGFSLPTESMGPWAQIFGEFLPITWFIRAQSQQWALASSWDYSVHCFTILFLFALIPSVLGGLLLSRVYPKRSVQENLL